MTDQARLLSCGLCYEEQGEAIHPHPECLIGQPRFAVTKHLMWMLLDSGAEHPVLYLARNEDTGAPIRLQVWAEARVPYRDIILHRIDMLDDVEDILREEGYEPAFLADYQKKVDQLLIKHMSEK